MTDFSQSDILNVYSAANYTYARAKLSFTRSPIVVLQAYLVPALLLVVCAYFGFFIDPTATPARVALGMLTIVVSANNFLGLTTQLPKTRAPHGPQPCPQGQGSGACRHAQAPAIS